MGTVQILDTTTRNPISLIGERAGVCWGADITEAVKNYKRGWDCITSGHGRTLEFVNVEMVLDGYSARVIREWYTHIGGAPTRLQASTRYINYEEFGYIMPQSIAANEVAGEEYQDAMRMIGHTINMLTDMGIPREDAALLLPLGMTTRVVDKRNLRNLIDMSRQRMCNRAYWEFRELFNDILDALIEYSDEWKAIATTQMKPKCDVLGYCPEKNGCGKYPKEGER
jgi:thymidylate synthase (FAD)